LIAVRKKEEMVLIAEASKESSPSGSFMEHLAEAASYSQNNEEIRHIPFFAFSEDGHTTHLAVS